MLRTQSAGTDCDPHVLVVGNYKGGCGKSTIAMHLIVALLKAGHRVASFDLDVQQQTLTRYIENRREWARHNALPLELPEHAVLADPGEGDGTDYVGLFTARLATLQNACDFIVIDTAGNASDLSLVAHGMADTLVTPLNDSFLDLDVIVAIGAGASAAPAPSHYAKAVAAALEGRRAVCGRATDWIVLRNRLAPFPSRNHRQITHVLDLVAPALGFRIAPGLAERPVFREFFPFGLTAFDQVHEPALDAGPGMSHVMARMEVRELVEEIGILASAPSIALDHVSGEELLSVP